MCGRFTTAVDTDDDTLERILYRAAVNSPDAAEYIRNHRTEIFPTDPAAVLYARAPEKRTIGAKYGIRCFRWGYPTETTLKSGRTGSRLLINAKAETACEKQLFAASLRTRRCVIPTSGFFEWSHDSDRTKYRFRLPTAQTLYLAGLYRPMETPDQRFPGIRHEFVILTTAANSAMQPIHDRMPVILPPEAVDSWLYRTDFAYDFLRQIPPPLEKTAVGI